MRILILGASGMLGHKLVQVMGREFDTWATVKNDFSPLERYGFFDRERTVTGVDAERIETVRPAVETLRPEVIINAVGIIKQLPTSKNVVRTLTVNSIFPHQLAEIAATRGARLITVSTDCVFSGEKGDYTEEDFPDARDLYGKSKNLGEVAEGGCLTLRTSIIGRELSTSHSLVEWFLSNRGRKVKGYVNAVYTGFPTIVLAQILSDIISNHTELRGLYHLSSEKIDKFRLLELINREFDAGVEIEPDGDFKIDRSLDSTKFRKATGFRPLSWDEMAAIMADDARIYKKWRT